MKHLDQRATELFLKAIPAPGTDKITTGGTQTAFTLTVHFMFSTLTPFGPATQYSFILEDSKKNRCPEMHFCVLDHRDPQHPSENYITVYPKTFIQNNLNIHQVSFGHQAGRFISFDARAQADQVIFANSWMRMLQAEGLIH